MTWITSQYRTLIIVGVCIAVSTLVFVLTKKPAEVPAIQQNVGEVTNEVPVIPSSSDPRIEVVGTSTEGRVIESYAFGTGETNLLFVGGIHGGYEWNSTLLAYTFIDHLTAHPELIPKNVTVTVVPSANPDGLFAVISKEGQFTLADIPKDTGTPGAGRFNAQGVDLNRNFDCKWQPESTWRGKVVSAGTQAFSEPESQAIRDVVLTTKPKAVIFWHSQANAVYASECKNGILPGTLTLMNTYAKAAVYKAVDSFDAYPVTGDAEGWLASINIPAITVEMATHETIEWEKNLAGVEAVLTQYSTEPTTLGR